MKKLISRAVEKFYQGSACYFCLALTDNLWCRACEQDFIKDCPRCPVCGQQASVSKTCGNCIISPPLYSRSTVLFDYTYPAKELLLSFKFKRRVELASLFAEHLAEKIISSGNTLPDQLVAVPLHKKRQADRGYNQSLELAKYLAKKLQLPVETGLSQRVKNTDPQSGLPMKSRRQNVKNAFTVSYSPAARHIAIVDDVLTTGSTVNELARTLKKAGSKQIEVWAIARTPNPN